MHKHNKTWSYGSYLSGELTEGRMDPRATGLAGFLRFQRLESLLCDKSFRCAAAEIRKLQIFLIRFVPLLHVQMAIVGRNSSLFCRGCFHLKDFALGCFIDNGGGIKWLRN